MTEQIKKEKKLKTNPKKSEIKCSVCGCTNYDPKYASDPAPCKNCGHSAFNHGV
jgi:hypothetical protein